MNRRIFPIVDATNFVGWAILNGILFLILVVFHFWQKNAWLTQLSYFLFFWSTLFFFLIYSYRGKNTIFQIGFITYLEALRKKIFLVLALFAFGTMGYSAFLSSVLPKDQLKILQTICFTTATLFGAVVAIFLSAAIIPKDIKDKTIFSIIPKPVRRFEYILGRLLGCWMVLAVLIFSMLLLCLFLVEWTLIDLGKESPALSAELASARLPYRPIKILDGQRKEILICKRCFLRVASIPQICKKSSEDPPNTCIPEAFSTLYPKNPNLLVPLTDEIIFQYEQLPLKQFNQGRSTEKLESPIQIHFPVMEGITRRIPFLFHFENPATQERISQKLFLPHSKEYWSYFPSHCISEDGKLNIIVSRLHPDLNMAGFGSLLVFGSVGRVEWIFIKCFFLLYLMLLLLSLLSLTCSTFLSTPVAVVFTGFLYLLGQMLDFLREFVESLRKKGGAVFEGLAETAAHAGEHGHHGHSHSEELIEHTDTWGSLFVDWIGNGIEFFCNYFIDFTRFDLTYLLRIGVDIPFPLFSQQVQYFCFCALPLLLIAYISFRYRELG